MADLGNAELKVPGAILSKGSLKAGITVSVLRLDADDGDGAEFGEDTGLTGLELLREGTSERQRDFMELHALHRTADHAHRLFEGEQVRAALASEVSQVTLEFPQLGKIRAQRWRVNACLQCQGVAALEKRFILHHLKELRAFPEHAIRG